MLARPRPRAASGGRHGGPHGGSFAGRGEGPRRRWGLRHAPAHAVLHGAHQVPAGALRSGPGLRRCVPSVDAAALSSVPLRRLVNGISDSQQSGKVAAAVDSLAQKAGLPRLLVEIRHAATHQQLPALPVLRRALLAVPSFCLCMASMEGTHPAPFPAHAGWRPARRWRGCGRVTGSCRSRTSARAGSACERPSRRTTRSAWRDSHAPGRPRPRLFWRPSVRSAAGRTADTLRRPHG